MEQELMQKKDRKTEPGKEGWIRIRLVHLELVREEGSLYGMKYLRNPEDAAGMARPLFAHADRERFVVVSLDSKLSPLACEVVATGGLDSCIVDIRNLFKHAILCNAAAVLCFHNHLSGDSTPSREDILVTKRIGKAGAILGIPLQDHIILGGGQGYYSFKEHGERWKGGGTDLL